LNYPASITDLFTPDTKLIDGSVRMIEAVSVMRSRLYLVNQHRRKLVQLVLKNESGIGKGTQHAQIKLIPYGTRRARIYRDQPNDPSIEVLHSGVELTYHGGAKDNQAPKIHLKAATGYKTLVDCSLNLSCDTSHPVPLFTFEPGHDFNKLKADEITKSAHIAEAGHTQPVRFDLYLAGRSFDVAAFVNSVYFFNLFWTPDYLIRAQHCPLGSGLIVAPVMIYQMGAYAILVRRSLSRHHGRPYLQFYNNASYYEKLMHRRTAWVDANGQTCWSTMAKEEERLLNQFAPGGDQSSISD